MKLYLVGNPNAGKSTLYNALTGGRAKVGNWHGVTVGEITGQVKGTETEVTDLPGIYAADTMSMEEKVTLAAVRRGDGVLLLVAECNSLLRSFSLFSELAKGQKCVLLLTKKRAFERAGGKIDEKELEKKLRLPVLSTEGLNARELKTEVLSAVKRAAEGEFGKELGGAYRPASLRTGGVEGLFLRGYFCIPFFLVLLVLTFFVTFGKGQLGTVCKDGIASFFCEFLAGKAEGIPSAVVKSFVIDGILNGVGGVLSFLPQIAILYFVLIVMEESGLFSRLAYHTDGLFAAVGLNGRAVFSLLMGFGCTAAAIASTRGLDEKGVQKRVILSLPYISCSAKLPVFLVLASSVFSNPFYGVLLLYAMGVVLSLLLSLFLKRGKQLFLMELAPLQIPRPRFVLKSLCFQLKQFIIKVSTVIFAFLVFSWLLSSFNPALQFCGEEESILAHLCKGISFLFAPIGCNDWRVAYAAISGLVAKENVAGVLLAYLGGFPYSRASAFAFACFILTCSPCISAVAACARETGWKRAILYAALQTVSALLFSYAVYFALTGGAVYLAIALAPALALCLLGKKKIEKVHGKRKYDAESVHR